MAATLSLTDFLILEANDQSLTPGFQYTHLEMFNVNPELQNENNTPFKSRIKL